MRGALLLVLALAPTALLCASPPALTAASASTASTSAAPASTPATASATATATAAPAAPTTTTAAAAVAAAAAAGLAARSVPRLGRRRPLLAAYLPFGWLRIPPRLVARRLPPGLSGGR